MDISIYKNKLLNEGFLNIKLDELYPDLVDTIQIFNNKEEYIQRLSNIQFDSIIFSDITYEYIKSLYCSNSDLINEERINIKEIEGNSHKKFTFKLKLKNPNYKFLYDFYVALTSAVKKGGAIYVWHASSEVINFGKAMVDAGWLLKQQLIWVKNTMVLGRQDYQWKHEPCLYGWLAGDIHKWYSDRKQTTIINFDKPQRNGEHPTMKPIGLFGYQIENSSKIGDLVIDAFGGSGTTMVACEQLKRKARLIELDPKYCDVIIQRWETLTGLKAELVNASR